MVSPLLILISCLGLADQKQSLSHVQTEVIVRSFNSDPYESGRIVEALLLESQSRSKDEMALVLAVMTIESRFVTRAVSSAGALGLMQVRPTALRDFIQGGVTPEQLLSDPSLNVQTGARYLFHLIRSFRGNVRLALMAYNMGPHALQSDGCMGCRAPDGVKTYASQVISQWAEWRRLLVIPKERRH